MWCHELLLDLELIDGAIADRLIHIALQAPALETRIRCAVILGVGQGTRMSPRIFHARVLLARSKQPTHGAHAPLFYLCGK